MKVSQLLAVSLLGAGLASAQQVNQDEDTTHWTPVTLAGEFLDHDFVNFYAFADGVYDSFAPTVNGQTSNGSFGTTLGGGLNAIHSFRDGQFSISYRGDFRDYTSSAYTSGTDQSLSIGYIKRLTRRWTLSTDVQGGIFFYGGTFFANPSTETTLVPNNPFSPESKFLSAGVSLAYQQTRRLSYVVSGNFFLQRYNYFGAIGTTGGSGSISALYRTTARTTIGATYSHSYFNYQRNVGTASSDSVYLTLSHTFRSHWAASLAGGFARSNSNGFVVIPVTLLIGNEAVGGYVVGAYHQIATFPSFSGSVSHNLRKTSIAVTAGQGLGAGNGYYLASRTDYINGVISHSYRRSNISGGGGFYRLSSVSNTVSTKYSNGSLTASYGVTLYKYFGANARYDFVYYGGFAPFAGVKDNRISFGLTFSSQKVPLTLY